MNIEQAFLQTENINRVKKLVKSRLESSPDIYGTQPDVGLPNSYESILAVEPKRKIAISGVTKGWISILESKEVNDYKMLLELSSELDTEVYAIVISDVTASCGFSRINKGYVLESHFSEDEEDFQGLIYNSLLKKGIEIPVCMFREVASRKIPGWQVISR